MNNTEAVNESVKQSFLTRTWVSYLLCALVAGPIVLWRLDAASLDEHEAKASLAGKEMYKPGGNWILQPPGLIDDDHPETLKKLDDPIPPYTQFNRWMIPINNAKPRLEKTPLAYWVMAGVAIARDKFDHWSARLGSALAAVLTVWIALALGRRMFSPRAALIGALMLATALGMQKWGRSARPEMLLCMTCTAAMALFYFAMNTRCIIAKTGYLSAFWIAMALANLSKQFLPLLLALPILAYLAWRESTTAGTRDSGYGTRENDDDTLPSPGPGSRVPRPVLKAAIFCIATAVGIVIAIYGSGLVESEKAKAGLMMAMVALPIGWYMIATRGYRQIMPLLPTAVPGVFVMCAFLLWMWYMTKQFPTATDIFDEQVGERATGSGMWSKAEIHYYFMPMITNTLPWVAFLPGALAAAWMKRFKENRDGLMYLFLWVAMLFLLLTLSAGKREHYLMPAVPALCLLMGFIAEDVLFNHKWIKPALSRVITFSYGCVAIIGPAIVGVLWLIDKVDAEKYSYFMIVAVAAAAVGIFILINASRQKFAAAFGLTVAAMLVVYVGFGHRAELWSSRDEVAAFGKEAREIIGDDKAASWGQQQMKLVYYFGRDIPSVLWTRDRTVHEEGVAAGSEKFSAWLAQPQNVPWIFTVKGPDSQKLEALGFKTRLQRDMTSERLKFRKGKFVTISDTTTFVLMEKRQ